MKVVINTCIGGFGLSDVAIARYENETGNDYSDWDVSRSDAVLVSIVEELAEDSWGSYAELKVVEIPDGIVWHISDDDTGREWVAEVHRTWS